MKDEDRFIGMSVETDDSNEPWLIYILMLLCPFIPVILNLIEWLFR